MNHQLLMNMFDESISLSTHLSGGFFLPAAHEFLMNAESNTHENAKKYEMKRRHEKSEEECKLIRRVRNIFVHEKPKRGRIRRRRIIPGNTRHRAMKVFVSLLIDFSLERSCRESSKLEPVDDR